MSPVTKYVTEKTELNDEEIDRLITKYLDIQEQNKVEKMRALLNDYFDTLRLAKEKAQGDDDTRILTKDEAISIIDNTLSRKYGQYLNTIMYIYADNVNATKAVFFIGVFSVYLAFSGLSLLIGAPLLVAGWLTVTNVYAAFRDFKRTRLVIVKEIEKLNNTIERLEKEENPNQEKIIKLKKIRSLLIKQSGYNKSDKKWKEVTTRKVYNKITNMYETYTNNIAEASDQVIDFLNNEYLLIMEAEDEEATEEKIDDQIDDATNANKDEGTDGEEASPDNPPVTENEDGGVTVDATTHDGGDEFSDAMTTFGDGDNSKEEKYKIQFCIDQLYILKNKYREIYDTLISSDSYRGIVYNEENKDNILLAQFAEELNKTNTNLFDYLETADFSSYSLVAIKLSTFNKIFEKLETDIATIMNKYVEEDED